jgi:ABC-type uncharacterized transport system ATPase subunit
LGKYKESEGEVASEIERVWRRGEVTGEIQGARRREEVASLMRERESDDRISDRQRKENEETRVLKFFRFRLSKSATWSGYESKIDPTVKKYVAKLTLNYA